MPRYLYRCLHCEYSFEIKKHMREATRDEECFLCGQKAVRKYTPIPHSFGWRLTEASHIRGNPDEFEKNI